MTFKERQTLPKLYCIMQIPLDHCFPTIISFSSLSHMDVLKHLSGEFVQRHPDQMPNSPQVAPSNSMHQMSELLTLSVRRSPATYQRNLICPPAPPWLNSFFAATAEYNVCVTTDAPKPRVHLPLHLPVTRFSPFQCVMKVINQASQQNQAQTFS